MTFQSGRHNAIINGGFDVWQRGTAATAAVVATANFLADRWAVIPAGADITQQRATVLPTGSRARYSLQLSGAASVTTCAIRQRIEASNIPGITRQVVFSAKIRNDSAASYTPSLVLGTPTAADNFGTVTTRLEQPLQVCAAGAWTTVFYSGDISSYPDIDNGLQVELVLPSGALTAGNTAYLTEIMIEPGTEVAPFEIWGIDAVMTACRRYFFRLGGLNSDQYMGTGFCAATTVCTFSVVLSVPMRIIPTLTVPNSAGFRITDSIGNYDTSAVIINTGTKQTPDLVEIRCTTSGLAAGSGARIRAITAADWFDFNAEL
jgi:hypothetical protein